MTGKEQMKTEATTLVAGVRSAVEAATQALAKAPKSADLIGRLRKRPSPWNK